MKAWRLTTVLFCFLYLSAELTALAERDAFWERIHLDGPEAKQPPTAARDTPPRGHPPEIHPDPAATEVLPGPVRFEPGMIGGYRWFQDRSHIESGGFGGVGVSWHPGWASSARLDFNLAYGSNRVRGTGTNPVLLEVLPPLLDGGPPELLTGEETFEAKVDARLFCYSLGITAPIHQNERWSTGLGARAGLFHIRTDRRDSRDLADARTQAFRNTLIEDGLLGPESTDAVPAASFEAGNESLWMAEAGLIFDYFLTRRTVGFIETRITWLDGYGQGDSAAGFGASAGVRIRF